MFTPPPSPGPKTAFGEQAAYFLSTPEPWAAKEDEDAPVLPVASDDIKRRIGKRTRWAALLVPIALIMITLSTRYTTHPAFLDVFAKPPSTDDWQNISHSSSNWRPHRRHVEDLAVTSSSPISSASPSATTSAIQTLPTIPSSPPTLPTPFPQPYDTTLSNNFSSTTCQSFFLNMTNTAPFRSCRPFSLLLRSSTAFVQAQTNVTLLNDIVWGTCNTDLSQDTCISNMAWFASALQTSCTQELSQQNEMAVDALTALQAFPLMLTASCLADPTTDTYCYMNSVVSSNPSDLYVYSLSLGLSWPTSVTATCSACTKSLFALYHSALGDGTQSPTLTGLKKTYGKAVDIAQQQCGAAYAQDSAASAGSRTMSGGLSVRVTLVLALGFAWLMS